MLLYHTYQKGSYVNHSELHSVSKSCATTNILEEGQQTSDCTPITTSIVHQSYEFLSAYHKLDLSMLDTEYTNRQHH